MHILLLLHVAATLLMFGVILVIQGVHYPLFNLVGSATYSTYQAEHMRRITWIVLPTMSVELLTGLGLVWWQPLGLSAWQAWTDLGLIALIWGSTAGLQVPLHRTLSDGFDERVHRRLVATNWIRTIAWGVRSVLVLWMLAPLLQQP